MEQKIYRAVRFGKGHQIAAQVGWTERVIPFEDRGVLFVGERDGVAYLGIRKKSEWPRGHKRDKVLFCADGWVPVLCQIEDGVILDWATIPMELFMGFSNSE